MIAELLAEALWRLLAPLLRLLVRGAMPPPLGDGRLLRVLRAPGPCEIVGVSEMSDSGCYADRDSSPRRTEGEV